MKKIILAAAALLLAVSMLAGCSAVNSEKAADAPVPGGAYYDSSESFNRDVSSSVTDPTSSLPLVGRKIIRNADLTVESLEFEAFMNAVLAKTNELGGYVESNNVTNRSGYYKNTLRSARMVVRIPAERLDEFLSAVNGAGNVVSSSENVDDVTDSYVDTEARLRSLRTEYETLLGLLERAETLDEIITLQDRLSNVRYQIESYEARIRSYDSQIAYSKVTLIVSEVERETAVDEESFGAEVSRRFRESLEDVGEGLRDLAAGFLGNFPVIFIWLVILVGIPLAVVFIIIGSVKRRRRKREAAKENKQ